MVKVDCRGTCETVGIRLVCGRQADAGLVETCDYDDMVHSLIGLVFLGPERPVVSGRNALGAYYGLARHTICNQ